MPYALGLSDGRGTGRGYETWGREMTPLIYHICYRSLHLSSLAMVAEPNVHGEFSIYRASFFLIPRALWKARAVRKCA